LTPYKRVIGIDPSEKMVGQARLALPQDGVGQFEFAQGSAEDLLMLPDSSVDLIIAGLFSPIVKWQESLSTCSLQRNPLIGSTGIRYGQKSPGF
jgi:trans-aconitate 3-methyltransferase